MAGDVLAGREERHQHSSEQPAPPWKMPNPERFGDVSEPQAEPADWFVPRGARAGVGSDASRVWHVPRHRGQGRSSLGASSIPAACQSFQRRGSLTWPGLPAAVSLGRAPLAITGTLGRKSILGCFPAEHRIKIPAPCSSSGGTEMREHTAQSFKDVCVSSSAACAMQGGHKTPGKPGLHGKQCPKRMP